jgi:hypothetical protein
MDVQAAAAEEVAGANAIDRLASIFVADTVLATQFNDMRRSRIGDEGIAKLWVAVLEDGIRCFIGNPVLPGGESVDPCTRRYRLQNEAAEWIFESNYEGPFSFAGLCEALGIDAGYLRERLAKRGPLPMPRRSPVIARTEQIGGRPRRIAMPWI